MKITKTNYKKTIKQVFLIIILSVLVCSSVFENVVFAYDSFYSNNDILFYDANASEISCTSTGGGNIVEKVWSYFIQKGLTAEQTAGIMGNMYQESSISPTDWQTINETDKTSTENIIDDNGSSAHAWGIVQWDGTRRYSVSTDSHGVKTKSGIIGKLLTEKPNLVKYLDSSYSSGGAVINGSASAGYTLTDDNPLANKNILEADLNELLTFELDYVWSEMPGEFNYSAKDNISTLDKIKTASSVLDATIIFHDYFERSSDSDEFVKTVRGGYAQAIYDKMRYLSVSNTCSTGNSFIDTIKSYVWEKYLGHYKDNGIVSVTPKAGYKAAVEEAQAAGRYTGDGCPKLYVGGGIDCGGFVTTIIHDSGWDVNYNAAKGNTTTQKAWLDANWQNLGEASTIDTSTLQPGDVAIYTDGDSGHTFVYIGTVDGYETQVASASQCQRAPMAGHESLTEAGYTWYRKK